MRTNAAFLILSLLCAPRAWAQSFEVSASAVWSGFSGSGELTPEAELEFDGAAGLGAGVAVHWTDHFSTELAAARINTDTTFRFVTPPAAELEIGELEMTPVTLVARWRFMPGGFVEPYIGAGGAYVMLGEISASSGLTELGLDRIDFEEAWGLAANAGVSLRIAENLRIGIDAKVLRVESDTRARYGGEEEDSQAVAVTMDPLVVSMGVAFRF